MYNKVKEYNSQPYYYHRNLQDDVIAIYDANGEKQVELPMLAGYVTKSKNSNQMKWGCEKCYLDFKDKFKFTDQIYGDKI